MKKSDQKDIDKCICKQLRFILGKNYCSAKMKKIPLNQFGIDQYDINEILLMAEADLKIPPGDLSSYFDPSMSINEFVLKFKGIYDELYIDFQLLRPLP